MSLSVLLVDPANEAQLRSRLSSIEPDAAIQSWSSDSNQTETPPESSLTLVHVGEDIQRDLETVSRLSKTSVWLVAVTGEGGHPEYCPQLADSGVCQFLSEACSDTELLLQLRHGARLKRLQILLAQAQKLQAIGELAAGIAHEINTPIQYVGDNTRFLQQSFEDIEKVLTHAKELVSAAGGTEKGGLEALVGSLEHADVDYLAEEVPVAIVQTLEGVARVANIVRAMKDFAHPGASHVTDTDLEKAISNTILVARNEWKYVAEIETDFDPKLPLVPCFPGELNQVLLNLIVNAAQAIGEKDETSSELKGKIKVATRAINDWAEIRIADSGTGIPAEHLDKIFQPFFTTKPCGKGTGQGLAIAHSVITDKHRGEIEVESEPGVGTTFVIRLPLWIERTAEGREGSLVATTT